MNYRGFRVGDIIGDLIFDMLNPWANGFAIGRHPMTTTTTAVASMGEHWGTNTVARGGGETHSSMPTKNVKFERGK